MIPTLQRIATLRWLHIALAVLLLSGQWAQLTHTHSELHAATAAACDFCAHADRTEHDNSAVVGVDFAQIPLTIALTESFVAVDSAAHCQLPPPRAPPATYFRS